MRQYFSSSSRPSPADRNPATLGVTSQVVGTGPHGATQRQLYTCPASRKASVYSVMNNWMRVTAAAPVGVVESYWRLNAAGAVNARLTQIYTLQNAVGDFQNAPSNGSVTLLAAETISLVTQDSSTGGTCTYTNAYVLGEYDA